MPSKTSTFAPPFGDKPSLRWADLCNKHIYHAFGSYPKDRTTNKLMHILMALAFYGERPIFKDKNGKLYVGICHHLIPDKLDYRPANLLCWLTREEHSEADRRQRLIKKAVGIEGMRELGYEQLRKYQDPRITSATEFEAWLYLFKEDQL